jgi:RNA polymerase sigma-70 factor (ECF subfamily)
MDIPMLFQARADIEDLKGTPGDLIIRAQNGDDEAFGAIFEQYHRFIHKFIFAMLGEQGLAEELTQETFLAAYKGIRNLRGEAKLQTWLGGIAKNIVYKYLRSNHQSGMKSDNEIESLNVCDEKSLSPDREFLSKELNRAIFLALKKLDADKRLIFSLKELQNLSYKEISEITGCTIPKLKTDLHRAKTEMRSMLRPFMEVRNGL